MLKNTLPILNHLSFYQRSHFKKDVVAGLMVASLLIPQSMAYAMLAGMPPVYGFYTAIFPLLVYSLFGPTRQLSVGPVAVISIMVFSSVSVIAPVGTSLFLQLVFFTTLLVGLIQLLLALFRFGALIQLIPTPVINGFMFALALTIILNQLEYIVNISFDKQLPFLFALKDLFSNIAMVDIVSLLVSSFLITIFLITKLTSTRIPSSIWVIMSGIGLTFVISLNQKGLPVVGDIPKVLPSFSIPTFYWEYMSILFPLALLIALIGYMESIAMVKYLNRQTKEKIRPNQELIALGLANVIGSCLLCLPVAGAFSRTAINAQVGAKSGLASIFAVIMVVVTLLYFTTVFTFLPMAALAIVIIVAALKIIDVDLLRGKRMSRLNYILFLGTLISSLVFGLKEGFLLGIVLGGFLYMSKVAIVK